MAARGWTMKEWQEKATHNFSPRTKLALKLYVSGACRNQAEAAQVAGISKQHVSNVRNSTTGRRFENEYDGQVQERAVSLSAVIARLSAKALDVMEQQIENGSTEQVKFMAARDILDRNPETSKTNKVAVESFTLGSRDAKAIALALAEGRSAREVFPEALTGDVIRVEETHSPAPFVDALAKEMEDAHTMVERIAKGELAVVPTESANPDGIAGGSGDNHGGSVPVAQEGH